ncbi:hypothetical protein L195_g013227 [Trifolium pratense]|uniref:Uncharacterized protein n=1 Tax=Trifolium pratense TaxID=57577 RepID=A0A2K3PMK3_TRIPR|nr:hypothetical protein L195_g013227 [Trifolium pratense]
MEPWMGILEEKRAVVVLERHLNRMQQLWKNPANGNRKEKTNRKEDIKMVQVESEVKLHDSPTTANPLPSSKLLDSSWAMEGQ